MNLYILTACVMVMLGCEIEPLPSPDPGPNCPYGCPPPVSGGGNNGGDQVDPTPTPPNPAPTYCGDRPYSHGVQLGIRPMGQQCQQWCWAASASMVSAYYGRSVTECQLASVLATAYNNGFQVNCCAQGICAPGLCDMAAQTQDLSNILGVALDLHGEYLPQALTERALAVELTNGRPVVIGYRGSFFGHAVVITGYGFNQNDVALFRVVDPYYGVFDVTYQQLAYGYLNGSLAWAETWYRLSPWTDGCNRNFDPRCGCN